MSIADNQISFTCYLKRGKLDANEEILYEPVHFIGYFSEYFPPSISHTPILLDTSNKNESSLGAPLWNAFCSYFTIA